MKRINEIEVEGGPLTIGRVEVHVLRCPISTPVRTSFGTMYDRPAVLVSVTDSDGCTGWGEIWSNFPACGAEHRAAIVSTVLAPMLTGRLVAHPADVFRDLTEGTAVLALQSAEPGPFAQAIAGIDLALWDLRARRAGLPLWKLLGGSADNIPVYASGLNPVGSAELVAEKLERGYEAFKLKVGFGVDQDVNNLKILREIIGPNRRLMVDANQAWALSEALTMAPLLAPFNLGWLEEPLRCDRPLNEWQTLAGNSPVPLAGGENIAGDDEFDAAIASRAFAVIQPDAAKWGGISGCLRVVRATQAAGLTYCPHYLGGGVGLLASAHLLAATGADGMLEIDSNPNPLRTLLHGPLDTLVNGRVSLGNAPGIGIEPNVTELRERIREAAASVDVFRKAAQ
ncbi:mandelate racemase/muconate lactonizing enzyme family protein [Paraburkholderia sp. DGU8]|jgi:L-alanine-DL-glutamate epimerase-like enolase superfamily enzyme|uniref:mandelate racemase/muconate lactonizing enzyme family protein n=1 Tax=Paraburkholderia sp. DGU8 TaxID=3161997 RepID=UPI00346735B1